MRHRDVRTLFFCALLLGCGELGEGDAICEALGDPGCPCTAAGECTDQPDGRYVCSAGLCVAAPCPVGNRGCACDDAGGCGPGLVCGEASVCEPGCAPGSAGCDCRPGGGCDRDASGRPQACIDDICQAPRCQLGTLGCFCDAADACLDGSVCDDGVCLADTGQTLDPPAEPACWTPCRGGEIEGPNGLITCEADGLIEGCIGDTLCVDGTCIEPAEMMLRQAAGQQISPCRHDRDCPESQNCIDGGCYSDCRVDADCNGKRVCHKRACRLPCTTPGDGVGCAAGYRCEAADGMTGVCLPNAPDDLITPDGTPAAAVAYPEDATSCGRRAWCSPRCRRTPAST